MYINKIKILFIFLCCCFIAGCDNTAQQKTEYFQKGEQLYEDGNYKEARDAYQKILEIDADDVEANFQLGLVMEAIQDWRSAARLYQRVLELDERHIKARIKIGQFYLISKAFSNALTEAEKALSFAPDNADALAFMGTLKLQQGDIPAARMNAEKALANEPENPGAVVLMSTLLVKEDKADEAISLLSEAISRYPKDARLKTVLASVYASQGENEQAITLVEELIRTRPESLASRLNLASLYVSMNQLDEAEGVMRKAITDLPDNAQVELLLIKFLSDYRGIDTARMELEKMVSAQADKYPLHFALAKMYESDGEREKAIELYRNIIEKEDLKPVAMKARIQIAELHARIREMDKARALLNEILNEYPDDLQSLTLRGRIALAENKAVAAIEDFGRVLQIEPASISVHRLLARAQAVNNEVDKALQTLEKAIDLSPKNIPVREEYMRLLAAKKDIDGVIDQLDEILKIDPNNLGAMQTLFRVQTSQKDWASAEKIVEKIKASHPDKALGYYFAGLLRQVQNQVEASVDEFKKALELAPNTSEPLTELVKSYLSLKKPELALEQLNKSISENEKNFVAHNLKGEVQLFSSQFKAALESFNNAINIKEDWALPYRNKANLYLLDKQEELAELTYKEGIEKTGSAILLVTELGQLYQNQGKLDQAIELYENVLIQDESNAIATNNLAMLLIDHRGDEASLKRAAVLIEQLKGKNNPAFLDTIGWFYYKRDNVEAALENLKKAVALLPELVELRYHLGMAYLKSGDKLSAKTELLNATESGKTFSGYDEAKAALEGL